MKFLWIDVNASYSHSNLALPAMEAQLPSTLREEIEWCVVSGTIKSLQEELMLRINKFEPQYIFGSLWLFNREYLLSLLERAVAVNHNRRVILGGPEFLGNNRDFLVNHPFVTAIFKGEGEELFAKIVESLLANQTLKEVKSALKSLPGIELLDGGRYIKKEAVKVQNFAKLKPPEESKLFNWEKPFVQLESSRGCFNHCAFCVSGREGGKIDNIAVGQLEKRIKNIESHGIKEIRVLDRTFNGNPARAVELLSLFKKFAGRIRFHLEIHPALINSKILKTLKNMPKGLLHLEAGIQSLEQSVITACGRIGSVEKSLLGLKELLKYPFIIHTDLIAGLPKYSYNSLLNDVKKLIELAPAEIQLELLKLLPGTHLREKSRKYNIAYSPLPPYEVLSTADISYEQLYKAKILSKILEYWYNDPAWQPFTIDLTLTLDSFLYTIIEYLSQREFLQRLYSFEGKSLLLYSICKEFYPQKLPLFTLYWVKAGLSLKKEPASPLQKWFATQSPVKNPIYDKNLKSSNYYYLNFEGLRHWFIFDYAVERHKPVKYFTEIVKFGTKND